MTFLRLHSFALQNPDIYCIAISHSDRISTVNWIESLQLPNSNGQATASHFTAPPDAITETRRSLPPNLYLISNPDRTLFGRYGLGTSSLGHVLSPSGLAAVIKLGREDGIWNKPTESGSRWQTAGAFAVSSDTRIVWSWIARRADDMANLQDAFEAIKR